MPVWGGFIGQSVVCSAVGSVGGLLPLGAIIGLWVLKYRRRELPRFNLIPHFSTILFSKIKALPKKKPRERSEQGRFFLSKLPCRKKDCTDLCWDCGEESFNWLIALIALNKCKRVGNLGSKVQRDVVPLGGVGGETQQGKTKERKQKKPEWKHSGYNQTC